jgi:outer membrane protein assembly factor BamE (lipoprotein component of BamABCDE complex)
METLPGEGMVGRCLLAACCAAAGLGLGLQCSRPAPAQAVVEEGHPIDRAALAGFQRGVTTRDEALDRLGEPTTTATDPADGSTTLSWHYVRKDAHGTTAVLAVLRFGPDGKLEMKAVSLNSQTR